MNYNYYGNNTFAYDNNGGNRYELNGNMTNPAEAANIISILSSPELSKMFSEEEVYKMKMYLKVSVLNSLKDFRVVEQGQDKKIDGMLR